MLDSIGSSDRDDTPDTKSDAGIEQKEPAKSDAGTEQKEPAKRAYKTETGSSTPYDDAFRFLSTEAHEFLPPFYAYAFTKKVWSPQNAKPEIHVLESAHPDASGKATIYSDSFCEMSNAGRMSGFYHTEMESSTKHLHPTKDKETGELLQPMIADRLVGYYLRNVSAHQEKIFNLSGVPTRYNIAVLALRSNANVPDTLTINVTGENAEEEPGEDDGIILDDSPLAEYTDSDAPDNAQSTLMPGTRTVFRVPVIKVDEISVEQLIAWRLYFLVPFHIVAYEGLLDKAFGAAGKSAEEKRQALEELEPKLRNDYDMIWNALSEDVGFTPGAKYDLMRCTENVIRGMCDLKRWACKDEITGLIFPAKEMGKMESYAKKIELKVREEMREEMREAQEKAAEAENRAVQHYVDDVRLSGMKDAAIIEKIEGIWGWSQEKARTAVLGAAT